MKGKHKVFVIAAHPDDEVLGCGGTLARHHQQGDHIEVMILADGVTSRKESGKRAQDVRHKAAYKANDILGVNKLHLLAYPDNRLDQVVLLEIVQQIEKVMQKLKPDIVYTHHRYDVNIDHTRIHDAVLAATRPQPDQTVRQLLFFETPSSTEWRPPHSAPPFAPNWFSDISDTLALKLKALAAYRDELRQFPHPRSLPAIEALARWRGACVGLQAAEAFELGRLIK